MKAALRCCAVLLVILAICPAQAQVPLVPYDDFEGNGGFIKRDRWVGNERGSIGTEAVRNIVGAAGTRRLHLVSRNYGDILAMPLNSSFAQQNDTRLRMEFLKPLELTAAKATATVTKVAATTCPGSITFSRAKLRVIDGAFFNAATPFPGSSVNDVTAEFSIERRSDSTDGAGVLRVTGSVFFCGDTDCRNGTELFFHNFGTLGRGVATTLRLDWDPDSDRFIFQRDTEPEVVYQYTLPDTAPPGFPLKRIVLAPRVANCTGAPRSVVFMEAFIDDVFVNGSAAAAVTALESGD